MNTHSTTPKSQAPRTISTESVGPAVPKETFQSPPEAGACTTRRMAVVLEENLLQGRKSRECIHYWSQVLKMYVHEAGEVTVDNEKRDRS